MGVRGIVTGSEALSSGRLTRHDLRTRYVKVHRNVYAPIGLELTAFDRAVAAWLWSRGEAVLVGCSAAAVLGTRWLPSDEPAELGRSRHHPSTGIVIRADAIADDEQQVSRGMTCTTPARTAHDLGRRLTGETAIIRIDALMNATKVRVEQVRSLAERYPGARGIRHLQATLRMVDGGAESPQETRLRLLLIDSSLPRPVTQIPVKNEYGKVVRRIDMGYPECEGRRRIRRRATFHFVGRALSTCRSLGRTSCRADPPRPSAEAAMVERNSSPCTRRTSSPR